MAGGSPFTLRRLSICCFYCLDIEEKDVQLDTQLSLGVTEESNIWVVLCVWNFSLTCSARTKCSCLTTNLFLKQSLSYNCSSKRLLRKDRMPWLWDMTNKWIETLKSWVAALPYDALTNAPITWQRLGRCHTWYQRSNYFVLDSTHLAMSKPIHHCYSILKMVLGYRHASSKE